MMHYVYNNDTGDVIGCHMSLEIAQMNCGDGCSIKTIDSGKKNELTKRINKDGQLELNPLNPLVLRPQRN